MLELTQNSSILRISDSKCYQLLDLYEGETCLWKTDDPDYRTRSQRIEAADRIAKKLRIKNFEARHVMMKFKNLRNSYCQELKKIGRSIALGQTGDALYQPTVFWFHKMDSFLRPYLQPGRAGAPQVTLALKCPCTTTRPVEDEDENDEEVKQEKVRQDEAMEEDEDDIIKVEEVEKILIPEFVDEEDTSVESEVVKKENETEEADCVKVPFVEERPPPPPPPVRKRNERQSGTKKTILMRVGNYRPRNPRDPRNLRVSRNPRDPRNLRDPRDLRVHNCCSGSRGCDQILQAMTLCSERLTAARGDPFDSFGQYVASLLRSLPTGTARALQPRIVHLLTAVDCSLPVGIPPLVSLNTGEKRNGDMS